jgi:pyridoxamine 5'-phosphate oxidase
LNGSDPVRQIAEDRTLARSQSDPNADVCFMAITGRDGSATVRTLVLREITENRFGVFLNKSSPKWRDLLATRNYEVLLFYPTLGRQYRLRGDFEEIPRALLRSNWQLRPEGSRYLDHYYEEKAPQSSVIESRQELISQIEALKQKYPSVEELPVPPSANGLDLVITSIDMLDISNIDRLHDRRRFTLAEHGWLEQVLVP